jgi:hypothetical protein
VRSLHVVPQGSAKLRTRITFLEKISLWYPSSSTTSDGEVQLENVKSEFRRIAVYVERMSDSPKEDEPEKSVRQKRTMSTCNTKDMGTVSSSTGVRIFFMEREGVRSQSAWLGIILDLSSVSTFILAVSLDGEPL